MRCLLPAVLAVPLAAAVPGLPEPGPGGAMPWFSLATANDLFASGQGNRDDFRTAGVDLQARWRGLALGCSGSMLTDRESDTRSDQLTVIAGAVFGPVAQRSGWHATAFAGLGLQQDGRIGGQDVQNWVHDNIQAQPVHLAYDPARGTRGVAGASLVGGWTGERFGTELVVSGSAVESGESIAEFGPRLTLVADGGALWAGPRLRVHGGDAAGATASRTLEHEDGLWLDLGAWITPGSTHGVGIGWQAHAGYDLTTRAATGSVGVITRPEDAGGYGRSTSLEHDLAFYSGGGFGVQLRGGALPADPDTARWATAWVLDYAYGTNPDGRLRWNLDSTGSDADLRHDQVTAGIEEGWRSRAWENLRLVLAGQAGAGLRSEGVVVQTPGEQRLEARATALVARGALAARVEFGRIFILGASLDGWLPGWREAVTAADGRAYMLNDAGWTWGLHLAGRLAW